MKFSRFSFYALLLIFPFASKADSIYREASGVIVIEPEKAVDDALWVPHSESDSPFAFVEGASGGGCIQFVGNSEASGPPSGVLTFNVRIDNSGDFRLRLRGLEAPLETKQGDKANDCYVRVVGLPKYKGEFTKLVLLGDSYEWSSELKLEVGHHEFESPLYTLKEGVHQLQIAGRSKNFFIDQIVVSRLPEDDAGSAIEAPLEVALDDAVEGKSYTYQAISDFQLLPAEKKKSEYYIDQNRGALAINAAKVAFRSLKADAERKFEGESGSYDFELRTLTELDGECLYTLSINGVEIGRMTNPGTDIDYRPSFYTWESVSVSKGDLIRISSMPKTNKKIPEGDGTAWARGRWTDLTLRGVN